MYTKVSLPTDIEEARILHSRVPSASSGLLTQVVKVVRYIRVMMPTVRDKPGLRESIVFLRALLSEEIEKLTAEVIDDHLGFIARNADDLANLELGLQRLERAAQTSDAVVEQMVEQVFRETLFGCGRQHEGTRKYLAARFGCRRRFVCAGNRAFDH